MSPYFRLFFHLLCYLIAYLIRKNAIFLNEPCHILLFAFHFEKKRIAIDFYAKDVELLIYDNDSDFKIIILVLVFFISTPRM